MLSLLAKLLSSAGLLSSHRHEVHQETDRPWIIFSGMCCSNIVETPKEHKL